MTHETLFVIIGTLIFFGFFLGVIVYAFDRRRKGEFDHQAQLPLEREHLNGESEGGCLERR